MPDKPDFVAVDDSGAFSYHRSEAELITAFEYVNEATCIVDRSGTQYRLALDSQRRPILGPAMHKVDIEWLGKAWAADHKSGAGEHKLRRFHPATPERLLRDLFETLELESGTSKTGPWILECGGHREHLPSLSEVDRRLSSQPDPGSCLVRDPYGHVYRPHKQRRDWSRPFITGLMFYVEIERREDPATGHLDKDGPEKG